jgi:protein-disulfide isomerase
MTTSDLRSAPVPEPAPEDHVRGPADGRRVVVYGDYECPFCAALELKLRALSLLVVFRHFPVTARHPRARAAALAAEAAGMQGVFWPMHEALFDDQARLEDPHLWARAERLGLDLARFDADRRSKAAADRVDAGFRSGLRAGVMSTPALFAGGQAVADPRDDAALQALVA